MEPVPFFPFRSVQRRSWVRGEQPQCAGGKPPAIDAASMPILPDMVFRSRAIYQCFTRRARATVSCVSSVLAVECIRALYILACMLRVRFVICEKTRRNRMRACHQQVLGESSEARKT